MSDIVEQGEWGICGFVSVLNALHQRGILQEFGQQLTLQQIQQRLVAEIVTYLKMRKIERPQVTDDILAFTRSFDPTFLKYQSIHDIINEMEQELRDHEDQTEDIINLRDDIGIAMTESAVQDYLKFSYVPYTTPTVGNPNLSQRELLKYHNCVVGLGGDDITVENGLQHWVYVDTIGILYNWSEKILLNKSNDKPKDLDDLTRICCVIRLIPLRRN